jgi:hypothetical protein
VQNPLPADEPNTNTKYFVTNSGKAKKNSKLVYNPINYTTSVQLVGQKET